jgi:folate-binding protein YgfZ
MTESLEYEALTRGAGWVDFRGRTRIELSGADAAPFLNSFCTNDIKRLMPGQGCEAFITSVQGKILGHVIVCCEADRLMLETVAGASEKLLPHLDRYIIREQVTLADRSQQWSEFLLAGAATPALLAELCGLVLPEAIWGSVSGALAGRSVVVQRADPMLGVPAFLLRTDASDWSGVQHALTESGVTTCSDATFDTARIEAGWPIYGRDISEQNLPQEVDRDTTAISFTKGCYLGQETVARIDALGHVNRTLRGLKFVGDTVPDAGTPLSAGDRQVAEVTSATFSPRLARPLALGYVRRGHEAPGSQLTSALGDVEVVRLPV